VTLEVRRNVAVVPAAAVQIGQQGSYVFVVGDDQKAQLRQVTAGAPAGEFAVIESGLQAGERVVINGQMRLSPGAPVEIREKPGAAPTASAPTAGTPEPAK
jgi:multidrug efflux system membrane fusion protein